MRVELAMRALPVKALDPLDCDELASSQIQIAAAPLTESAEAERTSENDHPRG